MIISLDFETYYSTEYSLSRMSEVDYILDPRFEVICCSFKIGKQRAYCIWNDDNAVGREIDRLEALYGWDAVAMLAQNTRFDGAILFWHYGKKPKLYLDTMGMAKATTHAIIGRSSLKKLAEYFGLPPKGEEVVMARGLSRAMFTPTQKLAYMGYCDHDNELCYAICEIQMRRFPVSEIFLIDWTLRMFIEPAVRLDASKLAVHLGWVRAEKEAIFARVAHIDKSVFSSQAKFAALLEEQGVEIPTKISPATGEEIYALAKGDAEFKDLCADESQTPYVQALLACRINAKSTIEETRTEKLLNLSLREWVDCPGWMPVPLRYYGAHTGRFSGDGGFNFQNLRRKSRLKEAIEAPPGYRILHRDASQIEARMVAFLALCHVLLRAFERGEDVYSIFATSVYGRRITKADEGERFVGKTCLAAGTLVLTDAGAIPIEHVKSHHKLWDGIEWVGHDGLMAYGPKETLTLYGVSLTPDHLVWCGTEWQEAQSLARDASGRSRRSALAAANLPSPGISSGSAAACSHSSRNVSAPRQNISSTATTSKISEAPAATPAPRRLLPRSATGYMPTPCLMMGTGPGCSTGSPLLSRAATAPQPKPTRTTAFAASRYILGGGLIGRPSCATRRPSRGGTTPCWRWIGATLMATMRRAISGSLRAARTYRTSARSRISNSASESWKPVFDLVNAGPRSRFTVLTNAGPLIVSNSILGLGYGMGPDRFKHTLHIGNGGMSIMLDEAEAKRIVYLYRSEYKEIPQLWQNAAAVLDSMVALAAPADGTNASNRQIGVPKIPAVEFSHDAIWLPNGMPIAYPEIQRRVSMGSNGQPSKEIVYKGPYGFKRLFGGKTIENISQALARIVVTDTVLRVKKEAQLLPFMTTHDSLDYLVPEENVREFDAYLDHQFSIRPSWGPTLPLASEGGWGRTLAEAEAKANV